MRILRLLLLIIFIITSVFFGVFQYRAYTDRDINKPEISSTEEELHLSVNSSIDDLLIGLTATDDVDGDVTKTLVVAGKSNFIEEGMIRVDYAAFDSHNNIGTYNRRVVYDDYHSPRFSSKDPLITRSEISSDFSFLEAQDVLEGDISNKIKIIYDSSTTDSSTEFPFTAEVTNRYGDVEKLDLSLDVVTNKEYNRQCPALSDYIIYVPVGSEADLSSYIIGIRQGDIVLDFEETDYYIEEVEINDYTDYERPGIYMAEFALRVSYSTYVESKMIIIVTEDF